MSQTAQTNSKPTGALGQQAAAAVTSNPKPATNVPAPVPAAPTAPGAPAAAAAAATPTTDVEAPKKKGSSKLFVVVGEVHEFDTFAQAEKFLNADDAPAAYSVLRGKKMKSKQKVSLR